MKLASTYLIVLLSGIIIFSLHSSCANRSAPTGGPRDETPPQLQSINPEHETLNFTGNEIVMEFDENINVVDLQNQLLITPDLDLEIESKVRKNSVIIRFDESLPDSTTFTFNFRDAVVDITENNPVENLTLAFSTGPYIDSLSLSGKTINHITREPIEDVKVAIYEAGDTLDIFNSKPLYVVSSDENGNFKFNNIKNDSFRLYGFIDKNRNGLCESNKEHYGFLPKTVKLDSNVANIELPLQFLDLNEVEMISARQSGRYFNLNYNKYILDYSLVLETEDSLVSHFSENHKTIRIYNTLEIQDSLRLISITTDSLYDQYYDTTYLKFEETKRDPEEYITRIGEATYYKDIGKLQWSVRFNKPSLLLNSDSIFVHLDSTEFMFLDLDTTGKFHSNNLEYEFTLVNDTIIGFYLDNKTEGERNPAFPELVINENSFISIEGDSSKELKTKPAILSRETTGLIQGKVKPDSVGIKVELINSKNVLTRTTSLHDFEFVYLKPETYILRVFFDINNNGHWDPADIRVFQPAEPVMYYQDPSSSDKQLPLKANWEIIDLLIDLKSDTTMTLSPDF